MFRALEDNDKLIVHKLEKGTPHEAKLEQEIQKLTRVRSALLSFCFFRD